MSINVTNEYKELVEALEKNGADASKYFDKRVASIIISGNKVVGLNNVKGIKITPEQIENGVKADIEIEEGVLLPIPIHICTGYVEKKGLQNIVFNIRIRKNAKVKFTAHCVFPQVEEFTHNAISNVIVEEGAIMEYNDEHFHSDLGTINLKQSQTQKSKRAAYTKIVLLLQRHE